ncbi:MAG: hypothetical protein M3340_02220 [Actinomycetota bacterium]|nr:hypothetical protein [Actinomycetota bacterium]
MKRAKYVGPSAEGVELPSVPLPDGQVGSAHVPQGGLLPLELRGQKVPAAFRDSLLEQEDWTAVNVSPKRAAKKKGASAPANEGGESAPDDAGAAGGEA